MCASLSQLLPVQFLQPLQLEQNLKPDEKASIFGPRQHEKVDPVWHYNPDHPRWDQVNFGCWFATGFEGSKWTNLCFENRVFPKHTLMFKYLIQDKAFTLDVFNEDGVGLGVTVLSEPLVIEY